MCLAHQFLQCFVEFARSSHRTRMSADKPRKSSHCALQNRGRERPPNPKSSPSDPGRAKKRVRSAPGASENFYVSANEPTSSEKARPEPPKSARGPKHPKRFSVISRWIFFFPLFPLFSFLSSSFPFPPLSFPSLFALCPLPLPFLW